ncbi:MAG: hypothetical protein Ta2D_03610 [Rickettsiales bacterium]|nr:MAG: hypothetical protein Ta2D_03610 [Rickettsiales bacterium]
MQKIIENKNIDNKIKNMINKIDMIIENNKVYEFSEIRDINAKPVISRVEGKYINDLENNIKTLKEQKPLFYLTGNEFQKQEGKNFKQQAQEFFNSLNNKVENSIINGDDIAMNGVGIHKMLVSQLYKEKCCALQAVPTLLTKHEDVSKNAIIMNKELKWKDREYDTYLIVGTIDIANIEHIAEIVIHEYDTGKKTFYLEEVENKEDFLVSFQYSTIATPPKSPTHNTILKQFVNNVKSFLNRE